MASAYIALEASNPTYIIPSCLDVWLCVESALFEVGRLLPAEVKGPRPPCRLIDAPMRTSGGFSVHDNRRTE